MEVKEKRVRLLDKKRVKLVHPPYPRNTPQPLLPPKISVAKA
jgi:hypothetical protein